jgi:hypothetical protein
MQFLLLAYDGTDPDALQRRLKVRENHLEKIEIQPFRHAKIE